MATGVTAVELLGVEHSAVDLALFATGWVIGWLMLWRPRPLTAPPGEQPRGGIAVVVPARDEADALPALLGALVPQLRADDELVVVDDHSTDGTGAVATRHGARVVVPPPLPDGWLGKPHACWHGASSTRAPSLVFVDADVTPAADLLDAVCAALDRHDTDVVSVQPWHRTSRAVEQASLLCNVTALMASGAFTPRGDRVRTTVAFGPVLALRRDVYERVDGHAAPAVRAMHTEDIGIARAVGRSHLHTGAPATTFRMYPDGLGQLVRGWTRSIATGARHTRWWCALATLAWVWSLAGGWLAAPIVYPLSAVQVWVLGRRAGSIHPLTAALYPAAVVVFVVIFLRSVLAVVLGRDVTWKGRRVAARSG
jgi:4,4'-diaponeurosporenoate glycosyltransferase